MGFLALISLLGLLVWPASAQGLGGDASLSGLALSQGRLNPAFASATTQYSASVGYTVSQITVTPSLNDAAASLAFLDPSDAALPDRDNLAAGHQVDLGVGENLFKVRVTAEDNLTTATYVVNVTRTEEDTVLEPVGQRSAERLRFERGLPGDLQWRLDQRRHPGPCSQRRPLLPIDWRCTQCRRDLS